MSGTGRYINCMKKMEDDWVLCPDCGYDQRQTNSERALPVGTVLNDKYSIGAVIGEGGFGITYAAWDMLIETRIAIKEYFPSELVTRDTTLQEENAAHNLILIQEKDGESHYREGLERFVKEAENLAKFQKQPGIVSVKDFFYENNTAYMVMEYIEGITLKSYLEKNNEKLGVEETLRMIEPVIKTLEAVHKEGVIHRDISPDNIMVTVDGQMKLIDFGAARFVGVDDEKSLTVILKHGYAPEEQYRSDGKQGPWTDVYALSAVIYRMLTGKTPEETLSRMADKHDNISVELKKVSGLSETVRKGLEKGLSVKAEKRFRTMEEFHNSIYNGKKYGVWKWAVGAGAMLAVFLCIFIAGLQNKGEETFSRAEEIQEELAEKNNAEEILGEEIETESEETGKEEIETEEIELATESEEIASFSEEELIALVEEYSGKYVGYMSDGKKSACYDDFDGDGRYELFAYVDTEWDEFGIGESGCSIWFSDGVQTIWVADLEDGWYMYEIGTLQFGKSKHFLLCRVMEVASAGYNTVTCALDNGVPHLVVGEENVYLYSVDGRTYCKIGEFNDYDAYGSNRYYENYSIFYKDEKYWEYASRYISEKELQKYINGENILSQIIESGKNLYIQGNGFDYDYSQYPYIEVENILLNSENEEVVVNMRHWKSKEEADYYKNLAEDDLIYALISIDGAASYPSETWLSVKDNMLQIEEMKFGHKEENGTEFTPLYPD